MRRGAGAILLVAALLAFPPIQGQTAQSTAPLPWWPIGDAGGVFHIRVPVTVTNNHAFPLTNAPVAAVVDVAAKLARDPPGWVTAAVGDRDILKAFVLDEASVRVVAMENLEPPAPGSRDGQLRAVDPTLPGAAKFEVPSAVFRGSLAEPSQLPYHPVTNPLITVLWRIPGTLQPGQQQSFVVYFDTLTNGRHAPSSNGGTRLGQTLQDLFWSGPGLTLYGQAFPWRGETGTVTVHAFNADTKVTAYLSGPEGDQLIPPPSGSFANPMVLGASQSTAMFITPGPPAFFKLVADKPIVAFASGAGVIPSLDEGVAGRSFIFPLVAPPPYEQDTVYFVSPASTPTTVRVQPLSGAGSFTFDLNNGNNPYPYTLGARGAGFSGPPGGCGPIQASGHAPLLPPGSGLYRATVTSGGPVQLHLQAADGVFQVPALDGSAAGTRFFAALSWSDQVFGFTNQGGTCFSANRLGRWFAAGADGPSTLRATSLDEGFQVYPRGAPGSSPAPAPVGPSTGRATQSEAIATSLDRPLEFEAPGGPVWLFAGLSPAFANPQFDLTGGVTTDPVPEIPLAGPLYGANLARNFTGLGPVRVVALFDDTTVTARRHHAASGLVVSREEMAAGGQVDFGHFSATDLLDGIRIDADRPIVVVPAFAKSGMLAGMPAFLDATLGDAEYRGRLLRLSSPQGLDPLTGSAAPGKPAVYAIQVTNLGRTATGGNLPDQVRLSLWGTNASWRASLDRTDLNLDSGKTETVHLTVAPTDRVEPGTFDRTEIRATSQGSIAEGLDPPIQDSLGVATRLTRSFDVGVWFDAVNGFKAQTKSVDASKRDPATGAITIPYNVVVQNKGSVRDGIDLHVDPPGSKLLTKDGREAGQVELDPGKSANLTLVVRLERDEQDRDTFVRASSFTAPAAFDTIWARSEVRLPSDLVLEADDPVQVVDAGAAALFRLRLTNRGEGDAPDVRLGVQGAAPRGWGNATLFKADAATGRLDPVDLLPVGKGKTLHLAVAIQAPANATAAEKASLRVSAGTADTPRARESFLYALVRSRHDLNATLPPLPLRLAEPGGVHSIPLRLRNEGNGDEFLEVRVTDLPAGWTLRLPAEVAVPRGATQAFRANLTVPPNAPPGTYNVSIALVSADGTRTSVRLPTLLGAFGHGNVSGPDALLAQPGRDVHALLPVANTGNTPLAVTAEAVEGEPWRLVPPTPLLLPPGGKGAVDLAWEVPATTPDGNTTHAAQLVLTPVEGTAPPVRQPVSVTVSVGRADLTAASAQAYAGASGTLVKALVRNLGDRDALDVRVTLLAGERAVDNVTIANLPAFASSNVTLVAASPHSGELSVQVDPGNGIVERNEANNLAPVASLAGRPAPLPAGVLCALALLAAAQARRKGKKT